uniref:Serine/threonine-protein kinase RIO1 n=1 Tax=Arundo donax TaxID=35708 RepID=A0A0A9DLL5_ARUDO
MKMVHGTRLIARWDLRKGRLLGRRTRRK